MAISRFEVTTRGDEFVEPGTFGEVLEAAIYDRPEEMTDDEQDDLYDAWLDEQFERYGMAEALTGSQPWVSE